MNLHERLKWIEKIKEKTQRLKKELIKDRHCNNCLYYNKSSKWNSSEKKFETLHSCNQFDLTFKESEYDMSKTFCDFWSKNETNKERICREINFRYND